MHPQADDDLNIGHRVYVAMTVLWYCPGLTPPLTCNCEWTRLVSEARSSSPVLCPRGSVRRDGPELDETVLAVVEDENDENVIEVREDGLKVGEIST